jgi:hypothetical protein
LLEYLLISKPLLPCKAIATQQSIMKQLKYITIPVSSNISKPCQIDKLFEELQGVSKKHYGNSTGCRAS